MPNTEDFIVEDDGLPMDEVGSWTEDKYRLVGLYDHLFSRGMKRKWDLRVYIDLYAGSGFSRVQGTRRILKGSPLIALGVADPFDGYVFCESSSKRIAALRQRVERLFPARDVSLVEGDCNEKVHDILRLIPQSSPTNSVLSLCFVDPYDLSIRFSTIRQLSTSRMDFLFLLALDMDANRNEEHYSDQLNPKIDDFLEKKDWREQWKKKKAQGLRFPQFLAEEFSTCMESIGYLPQPFYRMKHVRSDLRNLPLYHLALFSRHDRAYKFWDEVLTWSTDQRSFEF